ncbi:MAG: glycosyltransferase family 2 protein [Planctomycetes bacterium]|nr:glycosyltransferase family 2 protein [Planctomycetota bacterium]
MKKQTSPEQQNTCRISVIIVTWNSSSWIVNCLKSLRNDLRSLSHLIIIVDNASTDQTVSLIKTQFPETILIENKTNVGFAQACNTALLQSDSGYVLFLNPDTEVIPGMTDTLLIFMEEHHEAGAIGPTLLNPDSSLQLSGNTFPNLKNILSESLFLDRLFPHSRLFGSHKMSHIDRSKVFMVDWTMGSCLLVRRKALDKAGMFDSHYFLFFEETDLCLQLRNAGYKIYILPDAKLIHFGGASSPELYNTEKIIYYHRSLFYYFRKNMPQQLIFLKMIILVRSLLRIFLWLALYPSNTKTAGNKLRGYGMVAKLCFWTKKKF